MLSINFAFLAVMIYVVWVLPKWASEKERKQFVESSPFVFKKYKPGAWYFVCIVLVRNIAVAIVPSIATDDPCFQMSLLIALMTLSVMLQCHLWPWNAPICNMADAISLFGSCLVAVSAVPWLDV